MAFQYTMIACCSHTCADEDDVGLGIAALDDVAALGHALHRCAWQVGHALPRESQHGGPRLATGDIDALSVLNGNLHHTNSSALLLLTWQILPSPALTMHLNSDQAARSVRPERWNCQSRGIGLRSAQEDMISAGCLRV